MRGQTVRMKAFSLLAVALLWASTVTLAARQASPVAGAWKLNVAASNNPNGPEPAARSGAAPRRGGGGGGGGKASSIDVTGSSSEAPKEAAQGKSELTREEAARVKGLVDRFNHAANVLEISFEGTDILIKQDGGGLPKQTADGKKASMKSGFGELGIKVKLDGAKGMTREVTTSDDLKIVENYSLSADGKTLTVTVKASQPIMKIEDAKIKRVYEKQ